MSEHYYLEAIVRQMPGHRGVGGHHITPEGLILALDGKFALRVPGPLIERCRRILTQPGDKELSDLMIVDSVGVGRISDEYVCACFVQCCWQCFYKVISNNRITGRFVTVEKSNHFISAPYGII